LPAGEQLHKGYNSTVNKTARHMRKLVISLIGIPLFVVGLILIPVPGPGLLISFLALLLLSLEFDWAQKKLEAAKIELKKIYQSAKDRADKIEKLGKK
jgi:uncharacterized protein (TIGR02611 family)